MEEAVIMVILSVFRVMFRGMGFAIFVLSVGMVSGCGVWAAPGVCIPGDECFTMNIMKYDERSCFE